MRISIALCTYNGSRYVGDQLVSIAQQTRLPDELVICDDASRDDTPQIVESFASSAAFPVHFHRNARNLGSTPNFEQAIHRCDGDLIAMCDQDDYWYPNKLALIEETLNSHPASGMVFSDADIVDAQRQMLGYTLWQSVRFDARQQQAVNSGQALAVLLRHPVVTGATMAFRAAFRDLISPIPSLWIHDEWIALLIAIAAEVSVIRQPLIQYRRHAANQVGAESVSILSRLSIALHTDPQVYLKRYEQYQALHEHIAQRLPDETTILAAVDEKAGHLHARATLPDQHYRRISPILHELASGRYQHYSGSLLNPIRDFLLRH